MTGNHPEIPGELSIPPHSLPAEQSVLGGVIRDSRALDEVRGLLTDADFYRDTHQKIWLEICALSDSGRAFDVVSLESSLADKGLSELVGGLHYLGTIANEAGSVANIRHHAAIVRDKRLLRDLRAVSLEIEKAVFRPQSGGSAVLVEAEQAIFALAEQSTQDEGPIEPRAAVTETLDWLDAREQGGIRGLATGLPFFDKHTGGLMGGNLIVVAGRPKMGKTAVAIQFARRFAESGPALFVSLEMNRREVHTRNLSAMAGVAMKPMRDGNMSRDDWAAVTTESARLKQLPLIVFDPPSIGVAGVRSLARRIKRKQGLSAVIVDYLQLLRFPKGESRNIQVGEATTALKCMARELDVPVILLSQLSRDVEKRPDKHPQPSDLRDSGSIEQDADMVVFVYRDEVYWGSKNGLSGTMELDIALFRNGSPRKIWTAFDGDCQRITELDSPPEKPTPEPPPYRYGGAK